MAHKKKTLEELELAAHNRLKGSVCYHISSTLSQLNCIKIMLDRYLQGCEDAGEKQRVSRVLTSLYLIKEATKKLQNYTYIQLAIGASPTSHRRQSTTLKPKPYGTRK